MVSSCSKESPSNTPGERTRKTRKNRESIKEFLNHWGGEKGGVSTSRGYVELLVECCELPRSQNKV